MKIFFIITTLIVATLTIFTGVGWTIPAFTSHQQQVAFLNQYDIVTGGSTPAVLRTTDNGAVLLGYFCYLRDGSSAQLRIRQGGTIMASFVAKDGENHKFSYPISVQPRSDVVLERIGGTAKVDMFGLYYMDLPLN